MALINDFLSLIYPRHCQACGWLLFYHERHICRHCLLNLPKSNYHLDIDNPLSLMLGGRLPLQICLCLYLFEKSGKVQRLVHTIKYYQHRELAVFLGELLAKEFQSSGLKCDFDVIIPIPLHQKKLAERGFNQSEEFAKGLSNILGLPINTESLYRVNESKTQTKKKKYQRWENVEGIFELKPDANFENKHLLIVDDVVTTGATIDSAFQCLKSSENIRVSLACMAFTKPGHF